MNFAVAGVDHVSLSLALFLSQHDSVTAVTTASAKAEMLNNKKSRIADVKGNHGKSVSIFRLTLKSGSDNFRASAIRMGVKRFWAKNADSIVYGLTWAKGEFEGYRVVYLLDEFIKKAANVIIVNRMDVVLDGVAEKVYTRNIFRRD